MGVIEQVEKFKDDENEKCYMLFDLALAHRAAGALLLTRQY